MSIQKRSGAFWGFTFLHELGHYWISMERPQDEAILAGFQIFTDLVAICTLRKIIPPHKKSYREAVKARSYFGSIAREYFDKDSYKNLLQQPEIYLQIKVTELLKMEKR